MDSYSYIDKTGAQGTVQAADANSAIATAPNIDPNSGVRLVTPPASTPSSKPAVPAPTPVANTPPPTLATPTSTATPTPSSTSSSPTTPFDRGPALPAPIVPVAPQSSEYLIEQSRQEAQGLIDSISAGYDKQISDENDAGKIRDARTRALSVGAGLAGSDFASAAAEETSKSTQKNVASLEMQKQAKISEVLSNADARAEQRLQTQTANYRADSEAAIKQRSDNLATAKDDLKTLGSTGVNGDTLRTKDPALYKSLMDDTGMSSIEIDSYLAASNPKVDLKNVKTSIIGNTVVMSYLDPETNKIVTSEHNVEGANAYDGFTIAPDGTALFYNKGTGNVQVAGNTKEGQFIKPAAPKKAAGAAATPTPFTKPVYAKLGAVGIPSNLADKLYAAIASNNDLDTIRQAMKQDGQDPKLLDYFDNVVGIKNITKAKGGPKAAAAPVSIPGVTP